MSFKLPKVWYYLLHLMPKFNVMSDLMKLNPNLVESKVKNQSQRWNLSGNQSTQCTAQCWHVKRRKYLFADIIYQEISPEFLQSAGSFCFCFFPFSSPVVGVPGETGPLSAGVSVQCRPPCCVPQAAAGEAAPSRAALLPCRAASPQDPQQAQSVLGSAIENLRYLLSVKADT